VVLITPERLVELAGQLVKEKKGFRPVLLFLKDVSIVTDYFLIVSAYSRTQSMAIAEHLEDELEKHGANLLSKETDSDGKWLLLDYGALVVHVFQEETRDFYNLERLWGEAKLTEL
jgi:ribosome-associated protein